MSSRSPLHFALRAWFAFRLLRLRARTQPTDVPAVRSGDPRADRVLLIGNGPSHGWGVVTHQLALTGQLASAITGRTRRACDADLIGAEAMNLRSTLAWIGDRDLSTVDAVVLAVGFNDVLRLTPVAHWERDLRELLEGLAPRLRPGALLTLVGIPDVRVTPEFDGLVARLTARHRIALNISTAAVAGEFRAAYVELPEDAVERPPATPTTTYRALAAVIADAIAPRLLEERPTPPIREAEAEHEWDWAGTAEVVELARQGGDRDLRRLAEQAQKSFKVELAVVSLVDGDRLYYGNNTDVMPASVPLDLAFCKYTVESGEPVIIPDTGRDERFADNALRDVSFINFYAGYPLRATDGHVIGSFCLQGSQPRKESAVAMDLLRNLALEAEEVLQRFETPAEERARLAAEAAGEGFDDDLEDAFDDLEVADPIGPAPTGPAREV